MPDCDSDNALRLEGFVGILVYREQAPTRLAAAFFATFVDFLDVLPAIVFTPPFRRPTPALSGRGEHREPRSVGA